MNIGSTFADQGKCAPSCEQEGDALDLMRFSYFALEKCTISRASPPALLLNFKGVPSCSCEKQTAPQCLVGSGELAIEPLAAPLPAAPRPLCRT